MMMPEQTATAGKAGEPSGLAYLKSNISVILSLTESEGDGGEQELQKLLEQTRLYMEKKSEYLNATFLRKLFFLIKGAETTFAMKLKVPELLYFAARQNNKDDSTELAGLFEKIILSMKSNSQVESVHYFAECTIAYHTYFKEMSKGGGAKDGRQRGNSPKHQDQKRNQRYKNH